MEKLSKFELGLYPTKFEQDPTIIGLKNELNKAKSSLDSAYVNKRRPYHKWSWAFDQYGPLKETLTGMGVKYATNAFSKAWEIFYNFLHPKSGSVKLFANAELPGAFLAAFTYYMETVHPTTRYTWRASSLAPNSEGRDPTALGDTYGICESNRERWTMNSTNNGDMTISSNILDLETRFGPSSPFGGFDIYTHDAGMDVTSNFNDQETINLKLHLGCALSGFLLMKPGATFIAKQYTYFETASTDLISLYSTLFKEFYLYKPYTSRPYNSEIYLVGIDFLGITDSIKNRLFELLEKGFKPTDKLFSYSTPRELSIFAKKVFGRQIRYLQKNLDEYYKYTPKEIADYHQKESNEKIRKWLKEFPIQKLESEDQIAGK